ncbi:hypothetical protein E8E14_000902 [Neopestalotiopsis sp. 37M]|nr:hypothetical protein E8E14_000902 [Neopestalotiopsis sp. 37M]
MAVSTSTSAVTQAEFNLGPLTTQFVAPSYCQEVIAKCDDCPSGWLAQKCDGGGHKSQEDDSACWPPTATYARSATQPFLGWGFYSPGTICPSGYTPSCSSTAGQDGLQAFYFQFSLASLETAVGCCPTGFACAHAWDLSTQTCAATFSSTSIRTGSCNGRGDVSIAYMYKTSPFTINTTVSLADGDSVSSSVIDKYTVYAPLIQLVHKSSDLTDTSSLSPTTLSTHTEEPSPQYNRNQLSTGVAVAIGIGGTAAFIVLLLLAYFAWRRKQRKNTDSAAHPNPAPKSSSNAEAIVSTDFNLTYWELSGQARSELSAHEPGPRELPSDPQPIELANLLQNQPSRT